jgi:hypothetical protein
MHFAVGDGVKPAFSSTLLNQNTTNFAQVVTIVAVTFDLTISGGG